MITMTVGELRSLIANHADDTELIITTTDRHAYFTVDEIWSGMRNDAYISLVEVPA